jgi:hypothetical protein
VSRGTLAPARLLNDELDDARAGSCGITGLRTTEGLAEIVAAAIDILNRKA